MARTHRVWTFLTDEEKHLISACKPTDVTFGTHLRRLALERAMWLAGNRKIQKGIVPNQWQQPVPDGHGAYQQPPDDGPVLDTTDSQDLPPTPAIFRSMGRK